MPKSDSEAKGTLLVTGGNREIGVPVPTLAAERGYNVCLTYRTPSVGSPTSRGRDSSQRKTGIRGPRRPRVRK
jgi:NAD(P)-dependent dehydrogenase (short-subunit alcohol dehydrogenase family)